MKILLVSDIHAMSRELLKIDGVYKGSTGSFFHAESRRKSENPILAIAEAVAKEHPDIEALVCLGDLAHQAKQLPLLTIWHDLHWLARELKISEIFSVTGNHDIDSRANTPEDATERVEYLKVLDPPFPSLNQGFNNSYFSDGVASRELGDTLFIGVDTCRIHGLGAGQAEKVFSKGSISRSMTECVIAAVRASSCSHVVVAMHHHPQKVDEVVDTDYDQIPEGPDFLKRLGDEDRCCFILHGHKHIANVRRSGLGKKPAWIISASSLAAYPYRDQERFFSNQFHILEVDCQNQHYPSGKLFSWDWGLTAWEVSRKVLTPACRVFGREPDVTAIEQALIADTRTGFLPEDTLFQIHADLEFVTTVHIEAMNKTLATHGKRLIETHGRLEGMRYFEVRK